MKLHLATIIAILFYSNMLWASPASLLVGTQIDHHQLTLLNSQKNCRLAVKSKKQVLEIELTTQSPCYFFPSIKKNVVQVYAYNDKGVEQILLIGGTPAALSAEETKLKKFNRGSYCTKEIQALTLESGVIKLTKKTQAFACEGDRLDEKLYQQMLNQERIGLQTLLQKKAKRKQKQAVIAKEKDEKASFFSSLKSKIQRIFQ